MLKSPSDSTTLAFFGEIQSLTDELVPVTLRALTPCRLYVLTDEDFRELPRGCRDFERIVFKTMQRRMEGLTSFIRQREKMAALGTLAAGLAHELNNPAAAVVRALQDVIPALRELQRMNLVAGRNQIDEAHTQEWLGVRDDGYDAILHNRVDSLSQCDRWGGTARLARRLRRKRRLEASGAVSGGRN